MTWPDSVVRMHWDVRSQSSREVSEMTSDLCICHTRRAGGWGHWGDLGNHETELCTGQDQTSVFAFMYLGHRRNAGSAFLESSLVLLLNRLCHRHPRAPQEGKLLNSESSGFHSWLELAAPGLSLYPQWVTKAVKSPVFPASHYFRGFKKLAHVGTMGYPVLFRLGPWEIPVS